MSETISAIGRRAGELRGEFDRTFAQPIHFNAEAKTALLAVRLGGQPHALRLSDIGGLFADKKVTAIPGANAALKGIAGFRGSILPVYDLQVLLDLPGSKNPRWLVTVAVAPIALAFDAFEGQLRASRDEILLQPRRDDAGAYTREFLRTPNFLGPILHLPAIIGAVAAMKPAKCLDGGETLK